jgi:hypothetical protein
MDSKLVNHSTLSQQCLKSVSLKLLVIILSSENTQDWEKHKNSGSMIRQRLSDHTNGRTNVLKSKLMVPTEMFEWLKKSLQAGGKPSEMKMVTLSMIASWSGMSKEVWIVRGRMSKCGRSYQSELSLRLRKSLRVMRF